MQINKKLVREGGVNGLDTPENKEREAGDGFDRPEASGQEKIDISGGENEAPGIAKDSDISLPGKKDVPEASIETGFEIPSGSFVQQIFANPHKEDPSQLEEALRSALEQQIKENNKK